MFKIADELNLKLFPETSDKYTLPFTSNPPKPIPAKNTKLIHKKNDLVNPARNKHIPESNPAKIAVFFLPFQSLKNGKTTPENIFDKKTNETIHDFK